MACFCDDYDISCVIVIESYGNDEGKCILKVILQSIYVRKGKRPETIAHDFLLEIGRVNTPVC